MVAVRVSSGKTQNPVVVPPVSVTAALIPAPSDPISGAVLKPFQRSCDDDLESMMLGVKSDVDRPKKSFRKPHNAVISSISEPATASSGNRPQGKHLRHNANKKSESTASAAPAPPMGAAADLKGMAVALAAATPAPLLPLPLDQPLPSATPLADHIVAATTLAWGDLESLVAEESGMALRRRSNCMICLCDAPNIAALCCGVPLHLTCITRWLTRSQTCVQCRAPLVWESDNHVDGSGAWYTTTTIVDTSTTEERPTSPPGPLPSLDSDELRFILEQLASLS